MAHVASLTSTVHTVEIQTDKRNVSFLHLRHVYFTEAEINHATLKRERRLKEEEKGCAKLSVPDSNKITSAEDQHEHVI